MLHIEGSLLSPEILDRLEELPGQRDADFELAKGERLADAIVRAWSEAKALWQVFKSRMERAPEGDSGTSDTRRFWLEPLMDLLDFNPVYQQQGEQIEQHNYHISHRDGQPEGITLHLVGFGLELDKRRKGVDRLSPHALLQEYLNRKENFLYGLVSNGLYLRLLRDNARLRQQQYVEWDLRQIFEEDRFADFTQLYRLLHATRLRPRSDNAADCLLETYHQKGIEEGNRIRDGLRDAVVDALQIMGTGFLQHRDNNVLREAIESGDLSPEEYNRQLRRLVYRLLFLLVAEERELIFPDEVVATTEQRRARQIYRQYYSLFRLREMAALRRRCDGQAQNLWQELLVSFGIFETETYGKPFGITPLDGELFNPEALGSLKNAALSNAALLEALYHLHTYEDKKKGTRHRINYRSLDVEELGSVYESLLDLHPFISTTIPGGRPSFSFIQATDRKTTGSYYTRHDLVAELLRSALEPVMAERKAAAGKDLDKQAHALLSLKVCDPSCGSGHFLLAAARRISLELARVRSGGDDQPPTALVRACLREVIEHCLYGVDLNPDAVELCQVALWLESHYPGRPLSFLQHKIRCGNSLVGVHDLALLTKDLPDEAFKEVTGDDKQVAQMLRKQNKEWRTRKQLTLFGGEDLSAAKAPQQERAAAYRQFEALNDDTLDGRRAKAKAYEKLRNDQTWLRPLTACHLYTAAFFQTLKPGERYITAELLAKQQNTVLGASADAQLEGRAYGLASHYKFFHWPLEFPDVAAAGGFDVMLGNPPWERIKLQEKEFFVTRDGDIANAANKAERERMIKTIAITKPLLYSAFQDALHEADATGKFLRQSGRYQLTAVGDINTYPVFSELFSQMVQSEGRCGFIVPTGIATDDSNKAFFSAMVDQNRLASLFDFENREKIFPAVHSSQKFCLLTLAGHELGADAPTRFGFFLTRIEHLQDYMRIFHLGKDDFLRLNPNTRTCPVFRTRIDAELTAKIYRRVPILFDENTGKSPWGVRFMTMFHMSNDSHIFQTQPQLEEEEYIKKGNRFVKNGEVWLPLYEGKMIMLYDHRFADVVLTDNLIRQGQSDTLSESQHCDPERLLVPHYYVDLHKVENRCLDNFYLGFKDVTAPTNFRTFLPAFIPKVALNHKVPIMFLPESGAIKKSIFAGMISSIVFDFFARQKMGGTSMTYFYVKQFPALPPETIEFSHSQILPKIIELTYTSWDIKAFADDLWREADDDLRAALQQQWEGNKAATGGHAWQVPEWSDAYPEICWDQQGDGCPLPPFKWDEDRRARLRAELDAIYARLYGLTRDELRYILDPQDVYGPEFPGETFRVLKDKEMRMFGEYRTRRLVLEAWDEIEQNQ